jgi:hypothetical protein
MTPVRVPRVRRESGVLLLTVALLLATIAALAFGMNRAAGMDAAAVGAEYDRRNAAYLAEGALAAAKWYTQVKCKNDRFPTMKLAGATLDATITKGQAHQVAIVASAVTDSGATGTLARDKIDIYNIDNPERKTLGGAIQDTYIYAGQSDAKGAEPSLMLGQQSNALLSWATTDIPKDAKVFSATLSLAADGSSSATRTVNLHRVTTQWDASATWTRARFMVGWTGGDYDPQVLASVDVRGAGTYTMDVTTLVDAWYNNDQSNYGLLLRLPNPGQTVNFYSRETRGNPQPALNVVFGKVCP